MTKEQREALVQAVEILRELARYPRPMAEIGQACLRYSDRLMGLVRVLDADLKED